MSEPHQSIFRYSVTRPYPFRWFTPLVLVLFVATAIALSFLNLGSYGYDLIVQTSANPNATVDDDAWFRQLPAFLTSKARPSCQSSDIRTNSQVFTNQTALTYTLSGLWQQGSDASNVTILPSLTYLSNPLEQCSLTSIEIELEALDRSSNQIAYAEWGAIVRPFVTCAVNSGVGRIFINLTTSYDYVPETISFTGLPNFLGTNFLDRDPENRASLYWGESLMSMYWAYLTRTMQDIRVNATNHDEAGIRKGTMAFTPNATFATNITDLDFFTVDYRFVIDLGGGDFDIIYPGDYNNTGEAGSLSYLNGLNAYPNIWVQADSLAKSTFSTVMTDLGQTTASPNILTDPVLLQHFTANFSLALQHIANAQPGPLIKDYDTLHAVTGALGATPSVISTTYICQIPQLKSAGNLFVAVLIADLVFLQALWKILTLATDLFLLRKRPNAHNCQNCIQRSQVDYIGSPGLLTSPIEEDPAMSIRTRAMYNTAEPRWRTVQTQRLLK